MYGSAQRPKKQSPNNLYCTFICTCTIMLFFDIYILLRHTGFVLICLSFCFRYSVFFLKFVSVWLCFWIPLPATTIYYRITCFCVPLNTRICFWKPLQEIINCLTILRNVFSLCVVCVLCFFFRRCGAYPLDSRLRYFKICFFWMKNLLFLGVSERM